VQVARLHGLAVHAAAPRRRFAVAARLLQLALRLAVPGDAGAAGSCDGAIAGELEAAVREVRPRELLGPP
jgi:hypothetical protein